MNGKPKLITPALILFAAAGWGWGIYQNSTRPAATEAAASTSARSSSHRETRAPSISSLLPTARSARLFGSLDEIAAEPPGSVNKKLMSAMRTTLADNDPTRRNRDFTILLDLMRPEDAFAVHELFLELNRDGQTFSEYIPFANRWGQIDGAGALDSLMKEKPMRLPPQDFRNIIIGWSRNDPLAALAWMKDHPDLSSSHMNFDAVIQSWINVDKDAATRYLLDQPLSMNDRIRATRNAADEILSGSGVDATISWLTSFPANAENNAAATSAIDNIIWRLNELPYDKAANAWASLTKSSIGRIDQLERFTSAIGNARNATNGSRGFIDALAEKLPVEQATARFATWSEQDPMRVRNFLTQYADSPYIQSIQTQLEAKGIELPPAAPQGSDPFESTH